MEATLIDRVGYNLATGATPGYVDVHDDDGNAPVFSLGGGGSDFG